MRASLNYFNVVLVVPFALASAPVAKITTLDELVSQAQRHSLSVQEQKAAHAIAEEKRDQAKTNLYWPKFDLTATASKGFSADGPLTGEGGGSIPHRYGTKLGASQILFNGMYDTHSVTAAEQDVAIRALAVEESRRRLAFEVKSTWYDREILLHEQETLRASLAADGKLMEKAKAQYQAGLVPRSEFDLQNLTFLQTQLQAEKQIHDVARITEELVRLSGVAASDIAIPRADLTSLDESLAARINEIVSQGVDKATSILLSLYLAHNPAAKQVAMQNAIARTEREKLLAQYGPKISLDASWAFDAQEDRTPHGQDPLAISVQLTYPIFSAFDRRYQTRIQDQLIVEKSLAADIHRQEIQAKLYNIVSQLSTSQRAYALLKNRLAIRQGIFQDSQQKYQRGTGDVRNLLDDQEKLRSDELALIQSLGSIHKLVHELDYMTGVNAP